MATEILMPALSPTMEEGTLAKWLVKEGDTVKSGQILAEIETDKATMEFEATDEGVIGKLLVAEGTSGVKVNVAIALLLEDGESLSDAKPAAAAPAPAPAAAAPAAAPAAPAAPVAAAAPVASGARVFASPLARRIAKEKGLDLSAVQGSGPHGRIVRADVEGNFNSARLKRIDHTLDLLFGIVLNVSHVSGDALAPIVRDEPLQLFCTPHTGGDLSAEIGDVAIDGARRMAPAREQRACLRLQQCAVADEQEVLDQYAFVFDAAAVRRH